MDKGCKILENIEICDKDSSHSLNKVFSTTVMSVYQHPLTSILHLTSLVIVFHLLFQSHLMSFLLWGKIWLIENQSNLLDKRNCHSFGIFKSCISRVLIDSEARSKMVSGAGVRELRPYRGRNYCTGPDLASLGCSSPMIPIDICPWVWY